MTLLNLLSVINKKHPDASREDVCRIVNELEERIINEIFSPHGIERPRAELNAESDMHVNLILKDEYISLYVYFIYAVLALRELDFESSNSYSLLFNEKFKELAIFYRRNNLPVKNTILKGGI